MKKLLLASLLALVALPSLQAQCVPDTTINGLVVPPAGSQFLTVNGRDIVILPIGQVSVAYNEVLQFKVPSDTSFGQATGTIDSIRLVGVPNLPAPFSLGCTPSSCLFPGGTFGCGALTGVPVQNDSVELIVIVEYTITIGTLPPTPIRDTLEGYFLVVKGGGPVGLAEAAKVDGPRVYPNPAHDLLHVDMGERFNGSLSISISNLLGQEVMRKQIPASNSGRSILLQVGDLRPGVYLYSLSDKQSTFTGRLSIAR